MDKALAETSRLDIGCGAVPTGDVNLDLLIPGDERRPFDHRKIKNFILADCRYLPFPDNTFLEVYSSHFLEHVQDPDACLAEMLRVSRIRVCAIVPCHVFTIFYNLAHPPNYFWDKKHHKQRFWLNPFHARNVRLRYVRIKDAVLHGRPAFGPGLKIPIPRDTVTVIEK